MARARRGGVIGLWLALALAMGAAQVRAQGASSALDADLASDPALFLLVSINGRATGMIAQVALSATDQRISARCGALEQIGIAAPRALGRVVFLDDIPNLRYVYDRPAQALLIDVSGPAQMPVLISARTAAPARPAAQADWALALNYRAAANWGADVFGAGPAPADLSAQLDLRAISPFGVLRNTGVMRAPPAGPPVWTRTSTQFTAASAPLIATLTAGDFVTAGMAWTRPVALGGVQIRRDFALREDVLATPQLSVRGTAALPSSIEVYIDQIRTYRGQVAAGPFTLTDLPITASHGAAIVTLRDASGAQQQIAVPFFAAQNLLPKGGVDFAIAAGRAALTGPAGHIRYDSATARSASLRYGLSDQLTLGAHAEGLDGFAMAGLGADMVLFNRAEVSLGAAASAAGPDRGQLLYGALRGDIAGVVLRISTTRSMGRYQDLAAMIAADRAQLQGGSALPAKVQDALALGFLLTALGGHAGLTLIHRQRAKGTDRIVSGSLVLPLGGRGAALHLNGFADIAAGGNRGAGLTLSLPLGAAGYASVTAAANRHGRLAAQASLSRPASHSDGSAGYQIALSPDSGAIAGSYQSRYGRADLALRNLGGAVTGRAAFSGAVIWAGGGIFATRRINDAFAVVDVGLADVPVSLNNTPAARSDASGRALIPDLLSYQANRISIDPLDLPLDARIATTARIVVLARRAAVVVDLGGGAGAAALVILRNRAGGYVPVGAQVTLNGATMGAGSVTGYDGAVWLVGLRAQNRLTLRWDGQICRARFAHAPQQGAQDFIHGVICE